MIKSKKYQIGILGGSFDPPHKGHVIISLVGLKKLKLEKIYWTITKQNPFKKKTFFSLKERIKKCKNLTKNKRKIKVLSIDNLLKSSRTINILRYLKKKNEKYDLFLMIGSDNLISLHKWYRWKSIIRLAKIVVFSRKGYDLKAKKSHVVKFLGKKNFIFVNNKKIEISSTNLKKGYYKA